MSKSKYFTGQPILNQLLSYLQRHSIKYLAQSGGYDRYYKSFDTYTHLITMLYCSFNKCTSSREVISGMKACQHKLTHLGIAKSPGKSTLCDANMKRSSEVFSQIYQWLYKKYRHFLPDSHQSLKSNLYIADSSTITLFQEILRGTGMANKYNGKRKGGIKVHTLINAKDDVPVQVSFTSSRANDMTFLKEINLEKGSYIVFDKGYVDYYQYQRMSKEGVRFVTRQRKGAKYSHFASYLLSGNSREHGVLKDQVVILGTRTHAKKVKLMTRLITYYDKTKDRKFEFLTNDFDLAPEKIADLYRYRWQIEVLFKRVKQNFQLKYFLGDNENAIKIQIWCAFIADLLIKLVQAQLKRKWAFSNLSSIIRLHLMSYIDLYKFLNNPDKLPATTNRDQLLIRGFNFKNET